MIAYHADKMGDLPTGKIDIKKYNVASSALAYSLASDWFGEMLTPHGAHSLSPNVTPDSYIWNVNELMFEWVRRAHFPDKPSRFQCFFAVKTYDEALLWSEALAPIEVCPNKTIRRVEFDAIPFEADAGWRDTFESKPFMGGMFPVFVPDIAYDSAFKYWEGRVCTGPEPSRPELLIPLPVVALPLDAE